MNGRAAIVTPAQALAGQHVVIWNVPRGHPRAAADDTGKLLLFKLPGHAQLMADRLAAYGLAAAIRECTEADTADLLEANGIDDDDMTERVVIVEAQTMSLADARSWTIELADRLVQQLADRLAAYDEGAA